MEKLELIRVARELVAETMPKVPERDALTLIKIVIEFATMLALQWPEQDQQCTFMEGVYRGLCLTFRRWGVEPRVLQDWLREANADFDFTQAVPGEYLN